jgi:hypothetical protein
LPAAAEDTVQHETLRANHSYSGAGDFVVDGRYADVIHLAPARMQRGGSHSATHAPADGLEEAPQPFGRLAALLGRLWGGPGRSAATLRAQYGPRHTLLDLYALDTIVEGTCELLPSRGARAAAAPAAASADVEVEEGGADGDDGDDAAAKAV